MNKKLSEQIAGWISGNPRPDEWILKEWSREVSKLEDQLAESKPLMNNWISRTDSEPAEEPHRNVLLAYTDAANKVFVSETSSRIAGAINYFAWIEIPTYLPPKENES